MSQEYTPVDWVDETTSQQGTLINAERLTQMQTAHHYADGFEEVDAIPTEDPGVDYHKVVYCTADATFYRWDGTQWTADIDEDTKHLLDQEIARAEHAEGVLRADITAETTARENADTALGQRIDGLGADTLPMTHGTSTPTIQNAVAANAGNIDNLTNEVEGLEASKADKATTLAGYGITDAVATGGAQTVGGVKTFTDNPLVSNGEPAITIKNTDVSVSGTPASTEAAVIHFAGSDGEDLARIRMDKGSSGITTLRAYIHGPHADGEVRLVSDTQGNYMVGPSRAYDPTHASDIMTIGVFKAQTDTLLATKADTTALTDGSVTKVGTADLGTDLKPIKLVAGVPTAVTNDLVSTSGNQSVGGTKTFTADPYIYKSTPILNLEDNVASASTVPGSNRQLAIYMKDNGGGIVGRIEQWNVTSGTSDINITNNVTRNSLTPNPQIKLRVNADGTGAVIAPNQRAYNAANTTDVATIGTLDAYPAMLRTTGDQTALGTKRMWAVTYRGAITASNADAGTYTVLADLGVVLGQSGVHVGLSIMGRTGGFDGFISITSDENGILTATAVGTNVGGTATTIGACYDPNNNNEMYLVARRLTSAGQSFIVNIKGIEHGTSITVPIPTETAPVLTGITNYLEALRI